jgi:redox-regulated HSP33 family molecular chaperone
MRHSQFLPTRAGTLGVVRTQPLSPVPYTSTVCIESGEIAEDLTQYLAQSEQTNSAMALGVRLDSSGRVSAAGGYLVQVCSVQGCTFQEFTTTQNNNNKNNDCSSAQCVGDRGNT